MKFTKYMRPKEISAHNDNLQRINHNSNAVDLRVTGNDNTPSVTGLSERPSHVKTAISLTDVIGAYCKICTHKKRTRIKTMLLLQQSRKESVAFTSKDAMMVIIKHMIPRSFIISHVIDHYPVDLLKDIGIDLTAEYQAIEDMRSNAHAKDVDPKDMDKTYFDLQYGNTPAERFKNLFLEFGKLPTEIKDDHNITKEFVTQEFIDLWTRIKVTDVETCTKINIRFKKNLYRLPQIIGDLTNLNTIAVFGNGLQSLPSSIEKFTNLKTLFLVSNQFTSLPPVIVKLKNLESLSLSNNNLKSFPSVITELKNLKTLYLIGNPIAELPQTIRNLTNLDTLNLTDTPIEKTLKEKGEIPITVLNNKETQKLIKNILETQKQKEEESSVEDSFEELSADI